jgi:hypothetical protein
VSIYHLMSQVESLQRAVEAHMHEKLKPLRVLDANRTKLIEQLQRYGVCPCAAMGRYSTCCGKR